MALLKPLSIHGSCIQCASRKRSLGHDANDWIEKSYDTQFRARASSLEGQGRRSRGHTRWYGDPSKYF